MALVKSGRPLREPGFLPWIENIVEDFGDLALFTGKVLRGCLRGPSRGTIIPVCYVVGYQSVPVVMVTGLFIGMVLAVQSYSQFAVIGLQTRLGSIINFAVIEELGPVLAATMLAGRVGSSMAAELGTMRITEQIDALTCLGANPIRYLAVPRFLGCVLLIPILTIFANFMGVMGGALVSVQIFHIEAHHYWENSYGRIHLWDLFTGLVKPMFFGGAIALISCHRGMNSTGGAEGVGTAATRAFVASFIAILAIDFLLALLLENIYGIIWPGQESRAF